MSLHCPEFAQITVHSDGRLPLPLHFKNYLSRMTSRNEIDSLLVATVPGGRFRASIFAPNSESLSSQDAENRFIQNVLAERLVHLAGGEVAYVPRHASLQAIKYVIGLHALLPNVTGEQTARPPRVRRTLHPLVWWSLFLASL